MVRKREDVSRFAATYNDQRSKLLLFKFTIIAQPDCLSFMHVMAIQFRNLYLSLCQTGFFNYFFRHITCITYFCTVLYVSDVKWRVGELLLAQGLFKCIYWLYEVSLIQAWFIFKIHTTTPNRPDAPRRVLKRYD